MVPSVHVGAANLTMHARATTAKPCLADISTSAPQSQRHHQVDDSGQMLAWLPLNKAGCSLAAHNLGCAASPAATLFIRR
jgi:hypothetical protein